MAVVDAGGAARARSGGAHHAPGNGPRRRATTRRCPSRSCSPSRDRPGRPRDGRARARRRRGRAGRVRRALPRRGRFHRAPRRRRPGRRRADVARVRPDPACPGRRRRPALPVHLWAMQAAPADDERARRRGFVPERDLLQMRVALPLPDDVVAATRPLATRPFVPGRDEGAWVGHEQPGLRRPPRAGWVDGGPAPRAHGRRLGRARRVPGGRRPRRPGPDRVLLDQDPP